MDKSTLQIVIKAKDEVSKELKKVQKELKKVSTELNKMKKVGGTASKRVAKDLNKIGKEGLNAQGKIRKLVGTLQGLGALRLFTAIGIGLFVRQLGMAINNLSNEFVEFEDEMRRVNTITNLGAKGFARMIDEVQELSTAVPVGVKELATGLFDVASAGISAENQMAFLGVATKAAVAGFTDVQTVVQGLTAVMKGFGLAESDATRISDLFFQANKDGQTTVAEMAQAMQGLTTQAKLSGVGIEELFGIFSTFTGVTGNASVVATQMRGALNALAAPTKEASKKFKEMGIEVGKAAIESKGFAQVAKDVFDATGGNLELLRQLIPEIQAMQLVTALATDQWEDFAIKVDNLGEATGTTAIAFGEAMLSMQNQTEVAQNQLKFMFKEIAEGTAGAKIAITKGLVEGMFGFLQVIALLRIEFSTFVSSVLSGTKFMIEQWNKLPFIDDVDTSGLEHLITGFDEAAAEFQKDFDDLELDRTGLEDKFKEFVGSNVLKDLEGALKAPDLLDLSGTDQEVKGLLKIVQRVNSTLDDFEEAFRKAEESGNDSMSKLRIKSLQKIGDLDQGIRRVTQSLADLRTEFEKTKGSDIRGLAESFAGAEERVKELKEQLIRATDIQNIFDIKTQIKKEEDALEATKDVRKQFAEEIANAQRRAGLSDLERAIEDFNIKRSLAQQEFDEKQTRLQADRQAIIQKRNLEVQAFIAAQAEAKTQLDDKLKNITKEKEEFIKKVEKELRLEGDKNEVLKELFKEAADFREKTVIDSSNAIQGTITAEAALWERLASAISRATGSRSFAGFQTSTVPIGNFQSGGTVPQTGLFRLHQGETVLSRRETRDGGGVTVNIQGGTFLSEEAAEMMGDMIVDKLKTNIRI